MAIALGFQQAVREYLVTLDDRIAAIERVLDPTLAQAKSPQDKLSRLGRIYVDALIGEREYTEQKAGIEAALAKLSTGSAVRVDELNELRVLRNKCADFELVLDLEEGPRPLFSLAILGGEREALERLDVNVIVFNDRVKLEGRFPEALLISNAGSEAIDDESSSNDRSGSV